MMKLHKVKSSAIHSVGWELGRLVVVFSSRAKYVFDYVSRDEFNEILNAESVGKTFNKLVKSSKEGVYLGIHPEGLD